MTKNILHNKNSEKTLFLYDFFILILIGVVIVAGVFIFYSGDVDIREEESLALNNKISNCIIFQGYLRQDIFKKDFDIFNFCNLNREVIESGNFYLSIIATNGTGAKILEIREGTFSFENDCKISLGVKSKNFPKCVLKKSKVFYYNDKTLKESVSLSILTASNQNGRKGN